MVSDLKDVSVTNHESTDRSSSQQMSKAASPRQTTLMGWGLIALGVLLAYLFLAVWPSGLSPTAKGNDDQTTMLFNLLGKGVSLPITLDQKILLMVLAAGGLGSFVHAATSFGDYVGNEKLTSNWVWWYILRPFIGMALAAIFYVAIRGGFLSAGTDAGNINPFGIAALAGLVGMFSKQATDKLNEVFNTLFRTAPSEGDSKRKESLSNPIPSIIDVQPQSIEPGTQNVMITVKGTEFVKGAVTRINGVNRETTFNDPSQLTATLLPEDTKVPGDIAVTVFNPPPGGGISPPMKVTIAPAAAVSNIIDTESFLDGCNVPITNPTSDEDLPETQGGVA